MIEEIGELQQLLLKKSKISYKRYFYDSLEFDKLTGLLGARGVGKTTFLLWYFKNSKLSFSKKLYFSADSININSLFDLAKEFAKSGGKLLIIDEIHKFGNFESELKKIYDFLDLQVIFSGSSALKIDNSKADLSRRAVIYEVEGMSFREFLELHYGYEFKSFDLEKIIENYTRESGVRNLRRRVADIFRKVAKELLLDTSIRKISITIKNLDEYLDKKVFEIETRDKKDIVGQVNGLAWTSVGGDVLKVEAIKIKGKGAMQITGH